MQIVGFSTTRAGDWLDQKVSEQTDIPISQAVYIKERKLDFSNIIYEDDILFAYQVYYQSLIEYTFKNLAKRFKKVKSKFSGPIEIVIAGGTASPPGLQKKIEEVIESLDLPFEIRKIRISDDPKNSVVKGLLTQAIISQKKLEKKTEKEEEFDF